MKYLYLSVCVFSLSLVGCYGNGSSNDNGSSKQQIKNSLQSTTKENLTPRLGDPGFFMMNSFSGAGIQCVDLSDVPTKIENIQGGIYFSSTSAINSLERTLDLGVGANLQQTNLRFMGIAKQIDSLQETSKSISLMYYAEEHGTLSAILTNHSVSLTPFASDILYDNSLTETQKEILLKSYCGDTFVSGYNAMASIIATMKINFSSADQKDTFSAAIDAHASDVFKVFAEISSLAQQKKVSGSVDVEIKQYGGHPEELLKSLKTYGVESNIINCSVSNVTQCETIMRWISSYTGKLQEQLKTGTDYQMAAGKPILAMYSDLLYSGDDYMISSYVEEDNNGVIGTKSMKLYELLPKVSLLIDKINSDETILEQLLGTYDVSLATSDSGLAKLAGIRNTLKNINSVFATGQPSIADKNGYGALNNPSGDTLNRACFYPNSIFSYESTPDISAVKLNNILSQINSMGIDKHSKWLENKCGEYIISIVSQLNKATKNLVHLSADDGNLNYNNSYLDHINKPEIIVGGEYAKYLDNKLYLIPDYFDETGKVYNLVGADTNSDRVKGSKFILDYNGTSLRLAGKIDGVDIWHYPIFMLPLDFFNEGTANRDFSISDAGASPISLIWNKNNNNDKFRIITAKNLLIAPLFNQYDAHGCHSNDAAPKTELQCTGLNQLGVLALDNNNIHDNAAAMLYNKLFSHLSVSSNLFYSHSRFEQAISQIGSGSLIGVESVIQAKQACLYPKEVVYDATSDDKLQGTCVQLTADSKRCRVDQVNVSSDMSEIKSGCYPHDVVNNNVLDRDVIFNALYDVDLLNLSGLKSLTVNDIINQSFACQAPNKLGIFYSQILGSMDVNVSTVCYSTREQEQIYQTGVPFCNYPKLLVKKLVYNYNGTSYMASTQYDCLPKSLYKLVVKETSKSRELSTAYFNMKTDYRVNVYIDASLSFTDFVEKYNNCDLTSNQFIFEKDYRGQLKFTCSLKNYIVPSTIIASCSGGVNKLIPFVETEFIKSSGYQVKFVKCY